jgi:hypothetical protein
MTITKILAALEPRFRLERRIARMAEMVSPPVVNALRTTHTMVPTPVFSELSQRLERERADTNAFLTSALHRDALRLTSERFSYPILSAQTDLPAVDTAVRAVEPIGQTFVASRLQESLERSATLRTVADLQALDIAALKVSALLDRTPALSRTLTPMLLQAPAVSRYTAANAAAVLFRADWLREIEPEADATLTAQGRSLPRRLARLGPDFRKAYLGAVAALRSRRAERVRHFAISTRVLLLALIEVLAPEANALAWAKAQGVREPLTRDGKVKRAILLEYIARNAATRGFAVLLKADVRLVLNLLDLLNGEVHQLARSTPREEVRRLRYLTDEALLFILELAGR